jgi:hypothetical protein
MSVVAAPEPCTRPAPEVLDPNDIGGRSVGTRRRRASLNLLNACRRPAREERP